LHKKGFTLVELMIVIAIIAILATIIMPKMGTSRDKAKLAACKSNLRQIAVAMAMYGNDNSGNMCPIKDSWTTVAYLWDAKYLSFYPTCPIGNEYALVQNSSPSDWHGYSCTFIVSCWDGGLAGGGTHPGVTALMPAAINGQVVDKDK